MYQQSKPILPLELVHRIISIVLIDSLHLISTAVPAKVLPNNSLDKAYDYRWDINALTTLSCVCLQFKDICSDLALKAYIADQIADGTSPLLLVAQKLHTLYTLAMSLPQAAPPEIGAPNSVHTPLVAAYALYISVRRLHHYSIRGPRPILLVTGPCISATFDILRGLRSRIRPWTMGEVLEGAVEELAQASGCSLEIVQLAGNVAEGIGRLGELSGPSDYDEKTTERKDEIIRIINQNLTGIERANSVYMPVTAENKYGGVSGRLLPDELPAVLVNLTILSITPLLEPDHPTRTRAQDLLMRWKDARNPPPTCPFSISRGEHEADGVSGPPIEANETDERGEDAEEEEQEENQDPEEEDEQEQPEPRTQESLQAELLELQTQLAQAEAQAQANFAIIAEHVGVVERLLGIA